MTKDQKRWSESWLSTGNKLPRGRKCSVRAFPPHTPRSSVTRRYIKQNLQRGKRVEGKHSSCPRNRLERFQYKTRTETRHGADQLIWWWVLGSSVMSTLLRSGWRFAR